MTATLSDYSGWTVVFGIISDALPIDCRDPIAVGDRLDVRLRDTFPGVDVKILIQYGGRQIGMLRPRLIDPNGLPHLDGALHAKMMAIWEAIINSGPDPDLG